MQTVITDPYCTGDSPRMVEATCDEYVWVERKGIRRCGAAAFVVIEGDDYCEDHAVDLVADAQMEDRPALMEEIEQRLAGSDALLEDIQRFRAAVLERVGEPLAGNFAAA